MFKNNVYALKMQFRKTTENLTLISQNEYVFLSRHYSTIFLFKVLYFISIIVSTPLLL